MKCESTDLPKAGRTPHGRSIGVGNVRLIADLSLSLHRFRKAWGGNRHGSFLTTQ